MNNDISDVNKFVKSTSQCKMQSAGEVYSLRMPDEMPSKPSEDMAKSLNFLGAMGHAQVNMNNSLTKGVKASVDSFLDNPEYVEEHNEMCDKLVNEGLPLERAIDVTDKIFDTLKTDDTYK